MPLRAIDGPASRKGRQQRSSAAARTWASLLNSRLHITGRLRRKPAPHAKCTLLVVAFRLGMLP